MTSNVERFGDFYALKNDWLSKEPGINILTENKTRESYQWFVRNYNNYQNKLLVSVLHFYLKL
ncbi:hypothetical protein SAMN05421786_102555 [Chryseobacterium ureilyticum]|uniref:Uncharacterized protein n=1 Tax=Chryseobacterium ureilyticum TaxID=373668 RepID=A0A1N7MFT6_9FLAO|nr:hypothetical protein SAMN05421786_102555 [Chryseobacterium ureilyticum]